MDLAISARTRDLLARLNAFMDEHIYPNELLYHRQVAEGAALVPVLPKRLQKGAGR